MASTTQQRRSWAPACTGPWVRITLHGGARVTVRAAMRDAVLALNDVLKKYGYAATPPDTGAYTCRRITGGSGYSLHAYGIALDINWQSNPYTRGRLITDMPRPMVDEILAIRTNNGKQVWEWGGNWRTVKDAMHYEADCGPADIATGIRTYTPPPPPPNVDWDALRRYVAADLANKIGDQPTLRPGDDSVRVALLQQVLNFAIGARISVDGDYGDKTTNAVRNFQRFFNLNPDGVFGDRSRFVMVALLHHIRDGG